MENLFLLCCQVFYDLLKKKALNRTLKSFEQEIRKYFTIAQLRSSYYKQCFTNELNDSNLQKLTAAEIILSKVLQPQLQSHQLFILSSTPSQIKVKEETNLQPIIFEDYLMSETPKSKSEDIGFELEYETTPFNDFPNNGISPQTHSIMIKKVSTRELDFSNPNINIIKNEDSNNPNSIISSIVNKEDSDIYLKNRFEDFEGKQLFVSPCDQSFQSNKSQLKKNILRKNSTRIIINEENNSRNQLPPINGKISYLHKKNKSLGTHNNMQLSIYQQNTYQPSQNNSILTARSTQNFFIPDPENESHPLRKYILKGSKQMSNESEEGKIQYLPYIPINFNETPNVPTAYGDIDYLQIPQKTKKQKTLVQLRNIPSLWKKLKQLLNGMKINDGWEEGIQFNDLFIQHQGIGSSGLIACLQAYFIKHYHYILRIQRQDYNPMNKYKEQVMVNATIASIADILMTVYDGGSTQPAMLSKKIRLAFIKKIKDVKEIPIPLEQFNVVFLNSDNLLFLRQNWKPKVFLNYTMIYMNSSLTSSDLTIMVLSPFSTQ